MCESPFRPLDPSTTRPTFRIDAKEAELEYQRVDSEGPASHRKKDLLDKATKEAEHRERMQDLLLKVGCRGRREEASKKWLPYENLLCQALAHHCPPCGPTEHIPISPSLVVPDGAALCCRSPP